MKKLTNSLIESILKKAEISERKRAIYCFHNPDERLQRMINAGLSETYVQPHKHENPDKLEIFSILKGKVSILLFNNKGKILESIILNEEGENKVIEIPPKTWHNFVILSPNAVLYEIIDGKYNPETHKNFASWAPSQENILEAKKYLENLKKQIYNFDNLI